MDMREIRGIGKHTTHATTGRQPGDPTEEEIREACLEIQAGWNEVTRSGRKRAERPFDLGRVHRLVGMNE